MQKKTIWALIAVLIVIILVVGGYAIFHKSSPKPTNSSSTTSSSGSSSQSQTGTVNNAIVHTKTGTSLGNYLTDPNGNALYTYSGDSNGVSNCTGSCLSAWPAYQDKGSTTSLPANFGTIKRTDNSQIQYTYKGMPLYYFASDSTGQATGDGVSGFYLARP